MKQSVLFLLAILVSALVYGQQVERQQVVQEIGTGVWCVYCPGAAMGADDLLNSGADVAVIKYHSGDMYATAFSSARISFYGITGFPTSKFDGTVTSAGGHPSQSLYSTYLPLYNFRKGIATSFELSFDATTTGNQTDVTITAEKVFAYSGTNLVVHLVVTETDIPHNWFNQQYVKNVARLMIPNQAGTPLNFSSSNTQVVDLSFTLNPAWVKENIEMIAFIQDMSSKEIQQAGKIMFAEFWEDSKQDEIITCPNTPVTISGQDRYNTSEWLWSFPGGDPETSTDSVVEVTYALPGTYEVSLTISDGINSHTNVKTNYVTVVEPPEASMPIGPEVVDLYWVTSTEYETDPVADAVAYIWNLLPDDAGTVEGTGHTAVVTWNADFLGEAYLSVKVIDEMCEGEFSDELEIYVTNTVGIGSRSGMETISFFPNPAKGFLKFTIPEDILNDIRHIRISDLSGKMVWQQGEPSIPRSFSADLSGLRTGVYLLSITDAEKTRSYKINVIN